ncbi:hypothetical protein BGZ95_008638 [Linnemannia exigua]|uniref:Ndc10 domain-containing protein n=1 Tax=Linnemannia exigua TaxID=604196 RepID=A0AAD4DDV0_9FUNG|nr:hypothetical protein BGZ95_008638 [Linnemannia exigua]
MGSPIKEQINALLRLSYAPEADAGQQHSVATRTDPDQLGQEIPDSDENYYDVSSDDGQSDNNKRGADNYPYGSPQKRIRGDHELGKQQKHHRIAGQTSDLPSSTMTFQDNRAKFEEMLEQKSTTILRKQNRRRAPHAGPYIAQQAHWVEWCKRKKYPDGALMTGDKFFAFMKELVASEVHHNKNNPSLSVLPIRHNASDYYDGCMPELHTITSYIGMARYFYPEQCTDHGLMPNSKDTTRSEELDALVNAFHEQATKRKNWKLYAEDALYMLRKTTRLFRASDYRVNSSKCRFRWFASLRTRLHYSFDYFRADDLHSISDVLLSHIYIIATSGSEEGSRVMGIAIAKHSSVQNGMEEGLSVFERHPDVAVCPVGCLAFFLLALFGKVKDSRSFLIDVLQPYFLLHAVEHGAPLGDEVLQQNRRTLAAMVTRGLTMKFVRGQTSSLSETLKREHNKLDDIVVNSCPGNSSTRIQHSQRIVPCYLNPDESLNAPTKDIETFGAYKLIAFPIGNDRENDHDSGNDGTGGGAGRLRGVHRATLIPPPSLQRQLFPFLEEMPISGPDDGTADWKQWILNIMTDRPEDEGRRRRPLGNQRMYTNTISPAVQIALVLVFMRRVILQDMAVLMAFEDCPKGHDVDWQHCLFAGHPVFASKEFLDYAADLRAAVLVAERSLLEKDGDDEEEVMVWEEEIYEVPEVAAEYEENDHQEQDQFRHQQQQPQEQEQEAEEGDAVEESHSSAGAIYDGTPVPNSECLNSLQESLPGSPRHPLQEPTPEASLEPWPKLLRQPSPELLQEELSLKRLKTSWPESLPEPLEERSPLQMPSQEPLRVPEQSESELQRPIEYDMSQVPSENLCQASSRQGPMAPSLPPQPDNTSIGKLIARRQAIEDIKVAMIYLDQQARSQTTAVIEFSSTVVTTIESLQSRMKVLQDSLQKLHVKKAGSGTL